MAWEIKFSERSVKQLEALGHDNAKRIRMFLAKRIAMLDNPRQAGMPLQGNRLGEFWRYRVGDYRVICELQDQQLVVLVVQIGHRREIYR